MRGSDAYHRASNYSNLLVPMVALFLLAFNGSVQAKGLPDFTDMVETQGPAVVNISTVHHENMGNMQRFGPGGGQYPPDIFRYFFGDPGQVPHQEKRSLGSGFILSKDGYVLTNNHVIDGADQVFVRLSDRRELEAEVIGTDPRSDIALLKLEADNLPTVKLGRSEKLKVGEWVLAIGSPYGFDHTVTAGIVSAKERSLPNDNYVPFIQTDVAINPGNSGGPLFNLKGEVIGVNSQIYSRTGGFMGLSFAIPIDMALEVVDQLKESGSVARGWLGVMIQEVNKDLAESFGLDKPKGALVAQVLPEGPAAEAGIESGDVIVEFEGHEIELASELPQRVGRVKPGTDSKLVVVRDRKRKTLTVEIGQLPEEPLKTSHRSKKEEPSINRLGIKVQALTGNLRNELGFDEGVVVTEVKSGAGQRAGLTRGDVITKLDGKKVRDVGDFNEILDDLPSGKNVPLQISRRGSPMFLALKLKKEE